jgi:hypothetical protein
MVAMPPACEGRADELPAMPALEGLIGLGAGRSRHPGALPSLSTVH